MSDGQVLVLQEETELELSAITITRGLPILTRLRHAFDETGRGTLMPRLR